MGADFTHFLVQGGKLVGVDPEEAPEGAVLGKAVELRASLVDIETDQITLALEFSSGDKTIRREIPREKLTQMGLLELVAYGADTFPEVAKHYCTFLRDREAGVPRHYVHRGVGWGEYDGTLLFKHHRAVGFPSSYRGTQYAIAPMGTLAGWQALARAQILGRPWLELALVLGLSAPLVGLISRRTYFDSLFVHIFGTSSTGKTTAARVAVSPWGCPDTAGNGLIKMRWRRATSRRRRMGASRPCSWSRKPISRTRGGTTPPQSPGASMIARDWWRSVGRSSSER
jgi:putative DNA primase/helicase